jgi:DeoC/LacD family aldolase
VAGGGRLRRQPCRPANRPANSAATTSPRAPGSPRRCPPGTSPSRSRAAGHAVGKELTRDARYLRLATRICAELGAHFVKTYYCEQDFDTVAAACPVPLVMAGGRKLAERDALTMAYHAVCCGAAGVDMGRNIFQSDTPQAMIRAVGAVVHESAKPDDAYDQYLREPAPAG